MGYMCAICYWSGSSQRSLLPLDHYSTVSQTSSRERADCPHFAPFQLPDLCFSQFKPAVSYPEAKYGRWGLWFVELLYSAVLIYGMNMSKILLFGSK